MVFIVFIYLLFLLINLLFLLTIIFMFLACFIGAPFVPVNKKIVKECFEVINLKRGDIVYDLGSGDGRILIAAAKRGAKAYGWEINPVIWLLSKIRIRLAGVSKNVVVYLGSYWNASLHKADIVTLYLISYQMLRMEKKLLKELKSGSRVLSYAFNFPNWQPKLHTKSGIYVYEKD